MVKVSLASFPDVDAPKREVRFAPINRHPQRDGHVRLSANSGLVHRSGDSELGNLQKPTVADPDPGKVSLGLARRRSVAA